MDDMNFRNMLEQDAPQGEFTPYSFFSPEADSLTVYFKGDADFSKRLNAHITLFLSLEDPTEIVGCRIKGISGILEDLPNYIDVEHAGKKLRALFLPFRGSVQSEDERKVVNELAKKSGNLEYEEMCLL